jgi:hypothetical protein
MLRHALSGEEELEPALRECQERLPRAECLEPLEAVERAAAGRSPIRARDFLAVVEAVIRARTARRRWSSSVWADGRC